MGASISATQQASRMFERAGLHGSEPSGIGDLAVSLLGNRALTYSHEWRGEDAILTPDPWRICVRRGLSDPDVTMAIGRGLARWWCLIQRIDADGPHIEELAVALVLPQHAFRSAAARLACDPRAIAGEFVCPTGNVKLRLWSLRRPHRSGQFRRLGTAS
jgi:hypothetical protein